MASLALPSSRDWWTCAMETSRRGNAAATCTAADQEHSDQKHSDAAKVIGHGRDLGDQRAQNQSHDQAADVRGVISASDHRPKEEVVAHKRHHTAQHSSHGGARQRELA